MSYTEYAKVYQKKNKCTWLEAMKGASASYREQKVKEEKKAARQEKKAAKETKAKVKETKAKEPKEKKVIKVVKKKPAAEMLDTPIVI